MTLSEVPDPEIRIQPHRSKKQGRYANTRHYVWPDYTHIQIGVINEPPKPVELKNAKASYLTHKRAQTNKIDSGSPGNG